MFLNIMSEVRVVYEDLPGIWGYYLYKPLTKPFIIVNRQLGEEQRREIIIWLYQESLLRLEVPGANLYPLEISYPMSLPLPIHRQWLENNQLLKGLSGRQKARVIG